MLGEEGSPSWPSRSLLARSLGVSVSPMQEMRKRRQCVDLCANRKFCLLGEQYAARDHRREQLPATREEPFPAAAPRDRDFGQICPPTPSDSRLPLPPSARTPNWSVSSSAPKALRGVCEEERLASWRHDCPSSALLHCRPARARRQF